MQISFQSLYYGEVGLRSSPSPEPQGNGWVCWQGEARGFASRVYPLAPPSSSAAQNITRCSHCLTEPGAEVLRAQPARPAPGPAGARGAGTALSPQSDSREGSRRGSSF